MNAQTDTPFEAPERDSLADVWEQYSAASLIYADMVAGKVPATHDERRQQLNHCHGLHRQYIALYDGLPPHTCPDYRHAIEGYWLLIAAMFVVGVVAPPVAQSGSVLLFVATITAAGGVAGWAISWLRRLSKTNEVNHG